MAYFIKDTCLCCHNCALECPTGAIDYVGTRYQVDADKCIDCGHCAQVCNVGAAVSDVPEPVARPHPPLELEADIVVLGGGGSGMVAAVRAAECSGKKVIVLEKAKKYGGSAWFAGYNFSGLGGPPTPAPDEGKDDGEGKTLGDPMLAAMFKKQAELESKLDAELVHNVKTQKQAFIDWFESLPGAADHMVEVGPEGHRVLDIPEGQRMLFNTRCRDDAIGPGKGGSYIVYTMAQQFDRLGITLITGTRALSIEKDDAGAVCGVQAEDAGGSIHIRCRAVIVSTGGFAHNDELLRKYWPWFFSDDPEAEPVHRFAAPTNTGDVVPLGESAGAFLDYDNFFVNLFGPVHHPFNFFLFRFNLEPEVMTVNLDGKRFFDESFFSNGAAYIPYQPKRISYGIMDSDTMDLVAARNQAKPDGYKYMDYKDQIEEDKKNGVALFVEDSLEALAEKCGIDKDAFLETVARYNHFCETKVDEDFHKRPETLRPVVKPPFYAIYGKMATDGAFGGIKINGKTEAYAADGQSIIPGLYATGDNAAGWALSPHAQTGDRYMITNEMSWATISGFVAGANAAAYVCKEDDRP